MTIPVGQTIGAVFAAMSVQWTVARAVGTGMVKDHLPFVRTAKGGGARSAPPISRHSGKALLAALLIIGAVVLIATNRNDIREIKIFAGVLLIQSLPFISAVAMAALEASRANEFASWTALEARLAELVLRRAPIKAPAQVSPRRTADKRHRNSGRR